MRNLMQIMTESIKELEAIGIPVQGEKIQEISSMDNVKDEANGCCTIDKDGMYHICIWSRLLEESAAEPELKKIVCHELIHTCDGCMNHDRKFRKYAKLVDRHYGYNLMVYDDDATRKEAIQNVMSCPKCGCIRIVRDRQVSDDIAGMRGYVSPFQIRCPLCREYMREIAYISLERNPLQNRSV